MLGNAERKQGDEGKKEEFMLLNMEHNGENGYLKKQQSMSLKKKCHLEKEIVCTAELLSTIPCPQ